MLREVKLSKQGGLRDVACSLVSSELHVCPPVGRHLLVCYPRIQQVNVQQIVLTTTVQSPV